jgi:hypothetical protein
MDGDVYFSKLKFGYAPQRLVEGVTGKTKR